MEIVIYGGEKIGVCVHSDASCPTISQPGIDQNWLFGPFTTAEDGLQAARAVHRAREAAGIVFDSAPTLCESPYCKSRR
jgi:hypothetical protein